MTRLLTTLGQRVPNLNVSPAAEGSAPSPSGMTAATVTRPRVDFSSPDEQSSASQLPKFPSMSMWDAKAAKLDFVHTWESADPGWLEELTLCLSMHSNTGELRPPVNVMDAMVMPLIPQLLSPEFSAVMQALPATDA